MTTVSLPYQVGAAHAPIDPSPCCWTPFASACSPHIVARPVRKKTNWVFAVGRLTACDALAASLCGLVVRVGECGEVSKACAVQRAASAVVSSSPFVQQASLGSSSGGWMTPAAGWNLSRPHNGRQWLNRSVLTYSRGSEPLALRRRAQ